MWETVLQTLGHQWWSYQPESTVDQVLHWFNLAEGVVWCCLSLFVARRYLKYQRSLSEVAYAAGFALFGISDFMESFSLTTWLIAWKAINLLVLFVLRRHVLKHCYPEARWL